MNHRGSVSLITIKKKKTRKRSRMNKMKNMRFISLKKVAFFLLLVITSNINEVMLMEFVSVAKIYARSTFLHFFFFSFKFPFLL